MLSSPISLSLFPSRSGTLPFPLKREVDLRVSGVSETQAEFEVALMRFDRGHSSREISQRTGTSVNEEPRLRDERGWYDTRDHNGRPDGELGSFEEDRQDRREHVLSDDFRGCSSNGYRRRSRERKRLLEAGDFSSRPGMDRPCDRWEPPETAATRALFSTSPNEAHSSRRSRFDARRPDHHASITGATSTSGGYSGSPPAADLLKAAMLKGLVPVVADSATKARRELFVGNTPLGSAPSPCAML
ncbi:hypothetical protein AURANDRAFT_68903 [Aureococcus anophagefferens]|uniref:Uncharacterized protein n=1 Tax=Aureococcus anophagefferens TaxID=44056 RepID=F0YR42_AURAN|nr:hypothetical protein AURANDRAFT_68903 [Aureococcus anophagefferens]EGB02417.1 hypothetical protein AURANDRAFT_68903 [Aureococcus anophagefferens]|eukprot:XP_009042885.1 hypothetical protein AURANDRAFT_68903 [Aureococcus anophagefferens]